MKVIVTGSNGQMGQALQSIAKHYLGFEFLFYTSEMLNIVDINSCDTVFDTIQPDICVNFAAYTNVEKAEEEIELAYEVNAIGCKNLAEICLKYKTILVHISTDFVFNGEKNEPYVINDIPDPINVYGASKLKGEQYIQAIIKEHYIVRTSWVYSDFGHNFKNTMLRLAATKNEISVVSDQIGCPTNAVDVCRFIISLIQEKRAFGLYHFSGEKICSWYDFAKSIFEENKINILVKPIASSEYPTKAKRPKYSVLRGEERL